MSKFKADLKRGHAGEELWLANNAELTRLDGRQADFIDYMTGATYEVKTDFYSMNKTPNCFMECYSVLEQEKIGGPFQAWAKGITYYVYIYWPEKIALTFRTDELVYLIANLAKHNHWFSVQNEGWKTVGVLAQRSDLKGFYTQRRLK